jgi:hypothetical protein
LAGWKDKALVSHGLSPVLARRLSMKQHRHRSVAVAGWLDGVSKDR